MRAAEISPEQARAQLASVDPPLVVDVREPDEVAAWPFPGSIMAAILEINRQGAPTSEDEAADLEAGPNRCAVKTG